MTVSQSVLLDHSSTQEPSNSYFSFVKKYEGPPLKKSSSPLDDTELTPYIFADNKKTQVYIDNPILTDVTQAVHTDIHKILQQNPDVSGLSLILDDPAQNSASDRVSIEDFLPPSQYHDIFDIHEFVENSRKSFAMLPAKLRKMFNNDPAALCQAIEGKDPRAISALNEFLKPSELNSASEATVENPDVSQKQSPSTGAPVDSNQEKSK